MRGYDDDEDLDDSEYPGEWDEDDDSDDTIPCPHCLATIYDDTERCPKCGTYLEQADMPRYRPWWFIVGFLLSMYVALKWAFWF